MDSLVQDVRYAVRLLVRQPGFTAVAVLTLALGIGANTTIFSVVYSVLLKPLPYKDADRVVVANISVPDYRDLKETNQAFDDTAIWASNQYSLKAGDETETLLGATVSPNFFAMLGQPMLGRAFSEPEDHEALAVLSYDLWQRRFGAAPEVLGQAIELGGRSHTIVGVMPREFEFPNSEFKLWVTFGSAMAVTPQQAENRQLRIFRLLAHLRPGVAFEQAQAEMDAFARRQADQYPKTNEGVGLRLTPLYDRIVGDVRTPLFVLLATVGLVLLIACANVANLMLARASGRQREFCVRAALGAGRPRLVTQLLTECVLLGVASMPLALAIAHVGVWLLDNAVPPDQVPYYIHWEINARAIAYTFAVSAATGVVFGLAPALHAGRLNLQEALRDGARGSGQSGRRARLRNGLVVVEVALALVLLVGASLFVRSFLNLQNANPGFDTAPLLTLRVYMTGPAYASPDQRAQRIDDIVQRLETLPQVEAVFASNFIPLASGGGGGGALIDGKAVPPGEEPYIFLAGTTPHLQKTMGMPILKGRDFTDAEGISRTPVAVINTTMAARFWPDADPIGARFKLAQGEPSEWFTVIGVAPDIWRNNMDDDSPPLPGAFVPYRYAPTANTGLTIRTTGNPTAVAASIRAAIRAADSTLPIFAVQTMEDVRTTGFWQYRLFGYMFGIFGAAALFLAAIGVYGVLSFSVAQRTQEMGVRIALGASGSDVLGLVVRQGLTLAGIGVAIGLAGAFGITRVIQSLLYNVTATDPISFGGVSIFLALIAVLASYIPARRATNVDPIVALRND